MTTDRQPASDLESALRGFYRDHDPGPSPLGLRRRVDEVPSGFDRVPPLTMRQLMTPALGLAAALAILALAVGLVPQADLAAGPGASAAPTTTFDPNRTGFGLGRAFEATSPWFLVVVAALTLVGLAVRLRGRRALLPLAGAAGAVGYAIVGAFAPVDLHVTGWGPGLNVVEVTLPTGAEGPLYYETAKPGEPYSFGILLIGGDEQRVRIESVVDDNGSWYWTAVWLDGEPHGGMMGPAQPFAPFDMTPDGHAVWLVGRASSCALGRAPLEGEPLGSTWMDSVRVNVTVYGWPRVIELALPRVVEAWTDPCPLPDSYGTPPP
jgi:hypothetical protein